jgi:hypothetical protein
MAGDVTVGALQRVTHMPAPNLNRDGGNLIAGQNYFNVYFTGGNISNVTLTNCTITLDAINNTPIGAITPSTGAFTTLASGAYTITNTSANALAVGQSGVTNPIFAVNTNTASAVAGLLLTGAVTGGTVLLQATDSGTNTGLTINSKGTGNLALGPLGVASILFQTNGSTRVQFGQNNAIFTPGANGATQARFSYTGSADTAITLSTEAHIELFNNSAIRQWATGALTLQRDFRIQPSTIAFVGASTVTNAAAFSVDGATIAGTNATITNSHAIYVAGNAVGAGVGASYGLTINASSGGTANYAAQFLGGNVGIGISAPTSTLHVSGTSNVTGAALFGSTVGITGRLSPSTTNGIVGTTLADSAVSGSVGEIISQTVTKGSPVALATSVTANVTSISLTAGDWDVWATCGVVGTGTTVLSYYGFDISQTSLTQNTDGIANIGAPLVATSVTGRFVWAIAPTQINVSTTTTVYLVTNCGFSTSTMSAYGTLVARRRR